MMVQISLAQHDDVAPWLRLAEDVVPLFGPMPDFDAILVRKIAEQRTFSARTDIGSAGFIGGVLIGGSDLKHAIRWLAVSSEFRRLAVGKMLIEAALSSIPSDSTVHVDTFIAGSPGAEATKRLYKGCGFVPLEVWREGEVVRQRYMRPPLRRP
ncbi:GNAT family N-acetyltransferase [Rhizobium leguminosarum]|jgi:ribosomal protein S18 acetylase RimI-like enzyme|uniref:GNAT family N-acetyltransferase n=1 Tax=Rhizobium leguminosarum TaxID=384 RepID=UPI000FEC22D8|nr:GNAT family N-acetyltransferase [Rhizobium leguminosarum]RWX36006.1 N-acetyltransferase [Rhizobium leguminosarum]